MGVQALRIPPCNLIAIEATAAIYHPGVGVNPLGDGVLRVGARSIDVVEENGMRSEMTTEVLGLEAGRLLEVSLESPYMAGTNRLALSPASEGTVLTQTLTVRCRGFTRLLGPFMGATVQRKLDGDLARLRSAVESSESR